MLFWVRRPAGSHASTLSPSTWSGPPDGQAFFGGIRQVVSRPCSSVFEASCQTRRASTQHQTVCSSDHRGVPRPRGPRPSSGARACRFEQPRVRPERGISPRRRRRANKQINKNGQFLPRTESMDRRRRDDLTGLQHGPGRRHGESRQNRLAVKVRKDAREGGRLDDGRQATRNRGLEDRELPGQGAGLRKPRRLPTGDSYIVLKTTRVESKLTWDIHFWLGSTTSQDEMGTAAYKTVELEKTFLINAIVAETQGHESLQFTKLFKGDHVLGGRCGFWLPPRRGPYADQKIISALGRLARRPSGSLPCGP